MVAETARLDRLRAQLEREDWRTGLARRNDRVIPEERNWVHALRSAPELRGLLAFDQFCRKVVFTRSPPWRQAAAGSRLENADYVHAAKALQQLGVPTGAKLPECVDAVARDQLVHPVRDYLKGLRHDGRARLDTWAAVYLGATGPQQYLRAVGRKFLISGVARIFAPGCQVDHMLVLQGRQGLGKTTVARILAVRDEWFRGELPDVARESYGQLLTGKWLIELSELAALRRTESERMKAVVTTTHDDYRAPYARLPEQVPRQCVFLATTNERHFLRDATGNRRYWPICCGRIDLEALRRDRDQLWAEAAALFHAKAMWHLTEDEARLATVEQRERMVISELESEVTAYLRGLLEVGSHEASVRDVLVFALRLDPDKPDYAERAQRLGPPVAVAMEAAGWRKVGRNEQGGQRRTVYRYTQDGQGPTGL